MHDEPTPIDPAVTLQVGLAGAGLLLQTWLVDLGPDAAALSVSWFLVGALLLWLVHQRRSSAARWVLVVTGVLGAFLHATSTLGGAIALGTGLTLVAAFAMQAVAMLRPVVAEHCRTA